MILACSLFPSILCAHDDSQWFVMQWGGPCWEYPAQLSGVLLDIIS